MQQRTALWGEDVDAPRDLRRKINGGLNLVENWSAAQGSFFFGRGGETTYEVIGPISVWA